STCTSPTTRSTRCAGSRSTRRRRCCPTPTTARSSPASSMPEGDTIHYAANRIRPILAGRVPELRTPHPRLRGNRWPERLGGRAITAVDAHGKHLFVHFEGDLVIHSHLRMTGSWRVFAPRARWSRSPARAWLVLRRAGHA